MLPASLQRPFTAEVAAIYGVTTRTLARLRAAGLAVKDSSSYRLLEPIVPDRLALAAVGPGAGLCGVSAAARHGWHLAMEPDPVEVCVPPNRTPAHWPGVHVSRRLVDEADWTTTGDLRLTGQERTVVDLCIDLPLPESLVTLDGLLRDGLMTRETLGRVLTPSRRRPGYLRAATALRLADGRRASPPESIFRALVHGAGLPPPEEQFEVVVEGRVVARADFAWEQHRLIVEIDGFAYHSDSTAYVRDRQRQNRVVLDGWRVLRFAASELTSRPRAVVAEVRAALEG